MRSLTKFGLKPYLTVNFLRSIKTQYEGSDINVFNFEVRPKKITGLCKKMSDFIETVAH